MSVARPTPEPATPAGPAGLETVYLRRHPGGWGVSLDETLLHVLGSEAEAFAAALGIYRSAPERRRMLLLSGPQTGAGPHELRGTQRSAASLV